MFYLVLNAETLSHKELNNALVIRLNQAYTGRLCGLEFETKKCLCTGDLYRKEIKYWRQRATEHKINRHIKTPPPQQIALGLKGI